MLFLDNGESHPPKPTETTETTETVPSLGADPSWRSCAAADAAFSLAVVVVSLRKMHTMEVGDAQITTAKIAKKTSIKYSGEFFSWSETSNHWLVCYFIFF